LTNSPCPEMSIKVHLYSSLQQFTNDRNMVEVSGSTIGECFADLVKQFPKIKPVLFDKDVRSYFCLRQSEECIP